MQQITKFAEFLVPDIRAFEQYRSPKNELSYFKDIPISRLDEVRNALKIVGAIENFKFRIRFRGPRKDMMGLTCLKSDAVRFAVYIL